MKSLLLATILSLTSVANADTLGLHVGSIHIPQQQFNNYNPGMYWRGVNDLTAGFYYNSERRMSYYAGQTYDWKRFSLTAGIITGYGDLKPMLVPSVKIGTFRLAYLPRIGENGAHVVHLMYEFKE